ncbi:MAG: hypothetical protein LC793_10665, partial [Thermomicrobia bacterium]|nr:hypothetical protein [Thermomicrobia bacterium]
PLTQLTADITNNAVPRFVWIEPNQRNNGHDTNAAYADGWLSGFLPTILNSAAYRNGVRLIITFDEGETNAKCCGGEASGGNIGLVALSPNGPQGYVDTRQLDLYAIERTIGDLLGVTVPGAGVSAPTLVNLFASTTVTPSAIPTPTATASSDTGVAVGVWEAEPGSAQPFDAYDSKVGVAPAVLHFYEDWRYKFDTTDFDFIYARGAMPLMSWDAADWSHSRTDSRYALAKISGGTFDTYLTAWAQSAAAYGKRFYLRPAYEMNDNWSNWGVGVNGNTPPQYIAMWRHIHDIFAAAGATNVQWVWSPNCSSNQGVRGFTDLYPGDAYVDWVALDCYNWGMSKAKGTWQDPVTLFTDDYATLTKMTAKPLMIAETASSERGGDKAAWINQLQSALVANFPRVKCLLWFDENKGYDWRVDTSATALAAWQALVRSPTMRGRLP